MKPLLAFLFVSALIPFSSNAQRVAPAGVGGFGNVLHPGTGSVPIGRGSNAVYGSRSGRQATRSSGIIGYPLYVGGAYVPAYGSGYAGDYASQTQLAPQQQAPPVIINQYFGPPTAPEPTSSVYQPYAQRQQQQPDDVNDTPAPAPTKYYLLAFKDHSVYSALAYWVEDKTLHYVTPQNSHNQASLDLVDVDFTKQLNQDPAKPFSLETPSK